MPINQKHGLPRLPGGGKLLLSRGKFLDGTHKTYFGPGQTPEVGTDEGSYSPPTDWPGAGRLLRVPQVVCLSAMYPNLDNWTDGTATETTRDIYLELDGDPDTETSASETVEHAGVVELGRMLGVFAEVKSRIEALRPSRTFVNTADYFAIDPPDAEWSYNIDGYLPILAPPTLDPAHWFGTDFLHIYIGHIWDGGDHDGVQFEVVGPHVTPTDLADEPDYQSRRAKLVAAFDLFRRHATALYSAALTWTHVSYDPSATVLMSDGFTIIGNKLDLITGLNATRLGEIAADLADYGVTYEGDGAGLDADAIVARIADHYGFDPSTGADLG